MKHRRQFKAEARELIRTGSVSPLAVGAALTAVQIAASELSTYLETGSLTITQLLRYAESGDPNVFLAIATPSTLVTFLTILLSLLLSVLSAGFYSFCMGIRQGRRMSCASLMDGFGIAGKVIWCRILVAARIFLWTMLFIIPGIVVAYRCRFAMYNLMRDDSLSVGDAIAMSYRQTEGMKMELFLLDLSFIGWELLSILTFGILDAWRLPYIVLSELGYYEAACRRESALPAP